jgi:2-phosphosulfolactate phosphatase
MPTLTIRPFAGSLPRGAADAVIVGVDVIRATTTAITAVASGLRCVLADSLESALAQQGRLAPALLAGELGGNMPYGFDLQNSPTAVEALGAVDLPLILLSTSGTGMLMAAAARSLGQSNGSAAESGPLTLVACLRNWEAQATELIALRPDEVILLGAESRGEFREEDRLCCAWIAAALLDSGYRADPASRRIVDEWRDAPVDRIVDGKSAIYLRESGQVADLDFILGHVSDLRRTFEMRGDEVVARSSVPAA